MRFNARCPRCHSPLESASCQRCHAYRREKKLCHLKHDLHYHVELLKARANPEARCCITKRTAEELWRVGERLSVDRIDPNLGYVRGNCRLMAQSLNTARSNHSRIPHATINRLLQRLQRLVTNGRAP